MIDIKAIRERAERATKAPWIADTPKNIGKNWLIGSVLDAGVDSENRHWIVTTDNIHASEMTSGDAESDADFIAHARTDIPALCDRVEELEAAMKWQPMETAPRDGTPVLLLSAPYTVHFPDNGETIHYRAKVALGSWAAEGTSWVDEFGNPSGDAYELARTGVWESGGGWFQPNEVTHWMPLPDPPTGDE